MGQGGSSTLKPSEQPQPYVHYVVNLHDLTIRGKQTTLPLLNMGVGLPRSLPTVHATSGGVTAHVTNSQQALGERNGTALNRQNLQKHDTDIDRQRRGQGGQRPYPPLFLRSVAFGDPGPTLWQTRTVWEVWAVGIF